MAEGSARRLGLLCVMIPAMLRPALAEAGFGNPAKGQSLFVSKGCVECHAVRGAGGRIGPDLGRTAVKGSFYEIAAALWNHALTMSDKMKEFRLVRPSFRDDELADLLAFLYFLNYFDEPGDPKVGKVLFAQKHCIQCHSLGKEGGSAGPRLDALPRGTSPLRIAQDLWNHGPAMGRTIYAQKGCFVCHGPDGKGGIGPSLRGSSGEAKEPITQRMWNHVPLMREKMGAHQIPWPRFDAEELAALQALLADGWKSEPASQGALTKQQGGGSR